MFSGHQLWVYQKEGKTVFISQQWDVKFLSLIALIYLGMMIFWISLDC